MDFNIPLVTPIPNVTQSAMNFRLDQISRLFFAQFPQPTSLFTSDADVKDKANWDALIAASDITRVVYSPIFSMPKITGGKRLETAGDSNTTFQGMPETYDLGTVRFTGQFRSKDPASMQSINQLFNYSQQNTLGGTNLGVVMVNSARPNGQFFINTDYTFIPVWNFLVQPRTSEGFASADICDFAFDMQADWMANIKCIIPNFNPNGVYAS